jgi:hypothetical protein
MARPSVYDADRGERALRSFAGGATRSQVAADAGVGLRTLHEWLARGRSGDPELRDWSRRFDAIAELRRRARVAEYWRRYREESRERWRKFNASREAWWLRRLGPEEFWRRRLCWLASHGHDVAFVRTFDQLRAEGFRTNDTP